MIEYSTSNIRRWSRMGPSGACGQALTEIAKLNDRVVVCTADLCHFSGLDGLARSNPEKVINVGIAEQNLLGVAAGLAKEGFIPFVTTYASFATTRALDQVRVNMAYMGLPIKLIGLSSGLSAGILGPTHMSIEDLAIMRSLPKIEIFSPADAIETVKTLDLLAASDKPAYIRLTGDVTSGLVYSEDYDFDLGKSSIVRMGEDIAIIATGSMVSVAVSVAEELNKQSVSTAVINMNTIKPFDKNVLEIFRQCKLWVTIEEHSRIGGLGSAVSEYIVDNQLNMTLERYGIDDRYPHASDYQRLLEEEGLTEYDCHKRILEKWNVISVNRRL